MRKPAHSTKKTVQVLDVATPHTKEERRIWNIPGGYKKKEKKRFKYASANKSRLRNVNMKRPVHEILLYFNKKPGFT